MGTRFKAKRAVCGVWVIAALTTIAGCAVGPRYREPQVEVPTTFGANTPSHATAPASAALEADTTLATWWKLFNDPELSSLIERALHSNLDLLAAASRIRESRAALVSAEAGLFPKVSASGIGIHAHANTNPFAPGMPLSIKEFSLGFDASWEIDLFGGTRHAVAAARAQEQNAIYRYRDAAVSLTAEVANDYLSLRDVQARRALLTASAERERELLDLVAARASSGFVTELDVNQQRTALAAVNAEMPELDAQEAALIHALSVLLAQVPDALVGELRGSMAAPNPPQPPALGLPSQLLRRRPDVRAAERQLAAATEEVGVATANLFPKFNLLALASFANSSLGHLVSHESFSTAELGQISWPVFSAGSSRAAVRRSEEERNQAYFAYRKAVLAAVRDVEDSLVRYSSEVIRLQALETQQHAAEDSLTIAKQQYDAGTVAYLSVLQADNLMLQSQEQAVASRQLVSRDLAALYKALGGGWNGE